jgi:hypothetical protein
VVVHERPLIDQSTLAAIVYEQKVAHFNTVPGSEPRYLSGLQGYLQSESNMI